MNKDNHKTYGDALAHHISYNHVIHYESLPILEEMRKMTFSDLDKKEIVLTPQPDQDLRITSFKIRLT